MEHNPCQIQLGPKTSDSTVPLVLFHDAEGTILPYFHLGDLLRPLYGIWNPRFDQGGHWEHGFRQMGVVYTHLVRSVIPSGDIILGGWSLGGCLALEVGSRLKRLPQYTVKGVVLVDTVFPTSAVMAASPRTLAEVAASFKLPSQMSETRWTQSQQCILNSHQMQRDWCPPPLATRPPAVLIRAADPVQDDADKVPHYLDSARSCQYLGWEDCDASFIVARLEVPGNHFSLFDEIHRERTTSEICKACSVLAKPSP